MKVAVIGLGYVGLPLFINFSENNEIQCIGLDADEQKISLINKGKSYINHISSREIKNSISYGSYASSDFKKIKQVDAIIICVPTPINKNRDPDLTYVEDVITKILPHLKKNQIISLESTTYPGTSDDLIVKRIEERGFKVGKDFNVVYSPERENPGAGINIREIPKVVGGYSKKCLNKGLSLYSKIFNTVVPVSSLKIAELSKLLENIHRAVNLGMINEFKMICDAMGVDTYEVIKAAESKPFGFVPYYPGPGWGGHCIPVDPFYFSWKAKEFGLSAKFIELAGETNYAVISWLQNKIMKVLNIKGKSLKESKILILGLSYKEDVDDARESPSLSIFSWLKDKGALVDYSDPYFRSFPKTRKHNFKSKSVTLSEKNLKKYDLVILLTKHTTFDYKLIKQNSKLIIDTRGVYKEDKKKIFRG